MKLTKRGRIFDPTHHTLPNGCVQFAQSPQALVFEDFVRIYFSTRAVDEANAKVTAAIQGARFRRVPSMKSSRRTIAATTGSRAGTVKHIR